MAAIITKEANDYLLTLLFKYRKRIISSYSLPIFVAPFISDITPSIDTTFFDVERDGYSVGILELLDIDSGDTFSTSNAKYLDDDKWVFVTRIEDEIETPTAIYDYTNLIMWKNITEANVTAYGYYIFIQKNSTDKKLFAIEKLTPSQLGPGEVYPVSIMISY
jgi:hypothetical protein